MSTSTKRLAFPGVLILALPALLSLVQQPAQKPPEVERREFFRANYTKYEHFIPMRDGVRLFTSVYAPKDTSQPYPILLQRTPYSVAPYGADNYEDPHAGLNNFIRERFILVRQDVRGRNKSEGQFVNDRPYLPNKSGPKDIDESTDAYDTIDWLVKNIPNNNGKVGIWGISYPGFYAAMASIDAHPALKAASPQAPIADWFMGDDWRHNGAFFLAHAFGFLLFFGQPYVEPGQVPPPVVGRFERGTPDGYDFFLRLGPLRNIDSSLFGKEAGYWNELLSHDTYDQYWQARNIRPHMKNIRPAMMEVGGWFDAEDLLGPLAVYRATETQSPQASNMLVMGPWSHGGWMGEGDKLGDVRFGADTAAFFRDQIMLPFFVYHLKGRDDPRLPEAYVFETGRNQWNKHEKWPPSAAAERTFFLAPGGKLSTAQTQGEAGEGFDEYVSDPSKPVPFTSEIAEGMTYYYMTSDQRFAARRTDVLVYETEPLERDLTVTGPIECTLHVSTTGTDSDWIVKLIDSYPGNYPDPQPNTGNVRMGGYQQLVRGEPFRGRFRNSFEKPEPFEPGRVAKVAFTMPDVYHTFRRGHRMMVHIQSSWFPLVDRNPQNFVPIHQASEADFQKATQRVYRSAQSPSSIKLRVLE
ncbi:MAG: CocE/NonD family hydrolase [Acidobacteria bacterium]|nr:MAG: CocE/NonD family hydrolase [Acidobacteriota bacterium]